MQNFAKINVSYMRIWHFRLKKTKVKMYYANAKEKHVSELHGNAVERHTFVFLVRRTHNVQLFFKSICIFVTAAVVNSTPHFLHGSFNPAILPARKTLSL